METIGGQVFPAERIRDYVVQQATSITNGTEKTILTALSKYHQDLVMITGHNNSDAAITLDIRDNTGDTVRLKLTIPASSAKSWIFNTPYKQTLPGDNWTADMGDYTDTTVTIYVQAVKNKYA